MLCGCDAVDSSVLEKAREYWPQAELFHPRPDIVLIETHMSGITGQFAEKTFRAMMIENGRELRQAFEMSGYRVLILGFEGYHVVWSLPRERFWVLNDAQYSSVLHARPRDGQ